MISFQEAKTLIDTIQLASNIEYRPAEQCLGFVLAKDVHSAANLPMWSNSAMDGYAYSSSEISTPTELQIAFEIAAGHPISAPLPKGYCARIMTGAPMPREADTVIIQENTERINQNRVRFLKLPAPGANVRRVGEEVEVNELLLEKGIKLQARHLSLAINAGLSKLPVSTPPTVGIISTGDELVSPGTGLDFGQIWSTNTISLILALKDIGVVGIDCGIAKDNLNSTKERFNHALEKCDIIISTGGVSVGDFDVVKEALNQFNVEMQFWKVKMKPGKPIAFGSINNTPIFALPGNPVSCYISFYQFVRPFLLKSMGAKEIELKVVTAILIEDIRKKNNRLEFIRVMVTETERGLEVKRTGGQSSAWLSSMAKADALLAIPSDCHLLPKETTVKIQLLP